MNKFLSYFQNLTPKQWIYVIIAIILVIIILYVLFKKDDKTNIPDKSILNSNSVPIFQQSDSFPLKYGSKGNNVILMQNCLLKKGGKLPIYGADGEWGDETQKAVIFVFNKSQINSIDIANC